MLLLYIEIIKQIEKVERGNKNFKIFDISISCGLSIINTNIFFGGLKSFQISVLQFPDKLDIELHQYWTNFALADWLDMIWKYFFTLFVPHRLLT